MSAAPLLVELLTEELPPKALPRLGEVFARQIHAGLAERGLVSADAAYQWFATPRRLAILAPGVLAAAPDAVAFEKIMPVSVALDAGGQPTPALLKKLKARGIPAEAVPAFEKRLDGKSETFFHKAAVAGARLDEALSGIVAEALKKLPIPKLMRWGEAENSERQFARPAHGLVMLHGERVVPGEALGLASRGCTRGHRFLSSGEIVLGSANAYADALGTRGKVIAGFAERRAAVAAQLEARARELNAAIDPPEALLDEVAALVEWPVVYVGEFEAEYLDVPQECLILTMQQHQKYFPLFDAGRKLINRFLIVSNMEVEDPRHIIGGNARVVRPRLSDARFFYDQDRRTPLAARVERLGKVVYHNRLGSVLQRVERLEALSRKIAARLETTDAELAARAALLCKADLDTGMVGEFPELQGVMGRYYALHDGEDARVADAIRDHYRPRFAGDALPEGGIACAVALSDKLDALTGFFGIGLVPTGDKDPFGLRRAALGALRILMETPLPLDLTQLLADAQAGFPAGALTQPVADPLHDFLLERLRGLAKDAGYAPDVVESVLAQRPTRIDQVPRRLAAVRDFLRLPEALALAAANKRIGNILKKAEGDLPEPDAALLREDAEKALFERVAQLKPVVEARVAGENHADALKALASVRAEVDRFFDEVLVNADEPRLRANRLGLLEALSGLLNAVADISRLGVR